MLLRMVNVRPAGNSTRAHRNDQFRFRNGLVGLLQSDAHVFGHWAGNQKTVSVSRRCHELDPKSAQIEHQRVQDIDVGLTSITAPGADLPQLEGTTKQSSRLLVQGRSQLQS